MLKVLEYYYRYHIYDLSILAKRYLTFIWKGNSSLVETRPFKNFIFFAIIDSELSEKFIEKHINVISRNHGFTSLSYSKSFYGRFSSQTC